jgi:hypothetical protein
MFRALLYKNARFVIQMIRNYSIRPIGPRDYHPEPLFYINALKFDITH